MIRSKTAIVVIILLALSAAVYGYRVLVLRYPPLPAPQVKAWGVDLLISVTPHSSKETVTVEASLPRNSPHQLVVDERIGSGPLSMTVTENKDGRTVAWSGPVASPEEQVSYRATVVIRQRPAEATDQPPPGPPPSPALDREEVRMLLPAIEPLRKLVPARRLTAVLGAFRGERPADGSPQALTAEELGAFKTRHGASKALLAFLQSSGLPCRTVEGLPLKEGIAQETVRWIEVWTGKNWENVDPDKAAPYPPGEALLGLAIEDRPVLRVTGGNALETRWALSRQVVSPWQLHLEPILHQGGFFARWSLFSLPNEFQGTFRFLLLVPIGALMISILRNVVGFPTFGIFMPVLMALAFRTTGIFYGIAIFGGVVFIGYAARLLLNRLHLLLVPRLATILTLVVLCFAFLAVLGSKLGLRHMMAVGLLPFVILTMTVERFYVLIEESGVRQALLTAAGSAAVAVLTYHVLEIERLQLLFFIYPELLLAVGACQILLGRYTGYRLSEYIRFRALRKEP